MSNAIIIAVCSMLLLAYLAELSSEKTRLPAVILLLFIGWISRELTGILITILLFLSVLPTYNISFINDSLIIQIIIISVLVMAFGLIKNRKKILN
jgi:hypothetical protein